MPANKLSAISYQSSAKSKIKNTFFVLKNSVYCSLSTVHSSQAGAGQLLIILLLLVGVGLGTYLVQNRSQLFSRAASAEKASITNRSESVGADGVKQITFTWSDGRVSYDFKNADGNIIPGRAYAMRGTQRSNPTGQQVQGTTYITNWSDGTVEYNVFTDGKYDLSKSYATSGGTTAAATAPKTTTTAPVNTTTNTTPAKTTTTAPTTQTAVKTTTTTPAITTQTQTPVSTVDAQNMLTQFQNLKQTFNSTLINKVNVATVSSPLSPDSMKAIRDMINLTEISLFNGIYSSQNCISNPASNCSIALPPLLHYSLTAVRLTAFRLIFSAIPEVCTRADFGISPPITGTATNNVSGPIYLCSGSDGKEKKWRIFDAGNLPLTLSAADSAKWLPLNAPATSAQYPQAFQEKFSAANELINPIKGNNSIAP